MASARTAARRRTAIATALSVAGHAGIVLVIALDLRRDEAEAPPPVVEISLSPLDVRRPPEPAPQPPAAPPRAPRDAPQAVLPAIPPPPLAGPVSPAPAPSPPAAPAAQDLPTALRAGCVGRRDANVEARIDCKLEIWSVLDGKPPRALPGNAIPDDKESDWERVARRQDYRRRGLRPGGNASTIGCPQGNLGAGCLDEMLIPMTGAGARRRKELPGSGGG